MRELAQAREQETALRLREELRPPHLHSFSASLMSCVEAGQPGLRRNVGGWIRARWCDSELGLALPYCRGAMERGSFPQHSIHIAIHSPRGEATPPGGRKKCAGAFWPLHDVCAHKPGAVFERASKRPVSHVHQVQQLLPALTVFFCLRFCAFNFFKLWLHLLLITKSRVELGT